MRSTGSCDLVDAAAAPMSNANPDPLRTQRAGLCPRRMGGVKAVRHTEPSCSSVSSSQRVDAGKLGRVGDW